MLIIGFGHKKRVGKDESVKFAMAFCRQYYPHLRCEVMSFGDQLKNIAHQMYRWGGLETSIYYENNPHKIEEILPPIGKSPRDIWDDMGTLGRVIHPKTWVQMAAANAPDADVFFSKDVRFPTEIDLIDMFHGAKVRIDRKSAPKGGKVDEALDQYTGWDHVIENNGTLRQLNLQIKTLVARTLNKTQVMDKMVCPNCYARFEAVGIEGGYKCHACGKDYNAG